jgi:methionyl-tRNA synthetase
MVNVLFMIRIANLILHPIVPTGSELVAEYLGVNEDFFSWDNLDKNVDYFNPSRKVKAIEARFDFFKKLEYQY